jgi:hypothetical protein
MLDSEKKTAIDTNHHKQSYEEADKQPAHKDRILNAHP